MAGSAAAAAPMTVDFLRARLLSERSVSRASKERADQLAARVAELEEQVRAVTAQRRQAEQEAAEVLAVLESRGFCGSLSDAPDDSSSDNDGDEEKDACARVTDGDAERSPGEEPEQEQEQEPAAAKGEPEGDGMPEKALQPAGGGLSWKGRSASPRKARELRQRHRRSYAYFLTSQDPSPKYRMGQSCRRNKRKELSSGRSAAAEKGGDGGAELGAELDGEVGGGDRRSRDGGGQYVIRCEKDGEMERVLEKQAELIGQYQAEEKAQTDWEKKFNDNRSSPKGDIVQQKPNVRTLSIAEPPEDASEEYAARRRREAGEHHGQGRARTTAVSAQGSSNSNSTNQDQQGDANSDGCSSHNANSASSRQLAIRPPSESSPSSDTLASKVSDWSSSRFHDHADDQLDSRHQSNTSDIDVEGVLQALQRARISLQQKLGRPLPPNQVTLALPAPGDEHRTEEEDLYDDGADSYRGGEPGGSSPSRQEMLALTAPEDYHSCHESACLSVDGADSSSLTEKASSSSPARQEILALPAPGDDRLPGGERDGDMKIPVSSPGLFRLPTDSFPEDEVLSRSNGSDLVELRMRETARARHDACSRDDDVDAGVSAKRFYDPHGSAPASGGRCNVPPSSGFMVGGVSFRSGIPGLPEELRRGGSSLVDADLFMQRACDYTVTNKWML